MALILRNGGSQSPDRWLKEPRNNHEEREMLFVNDCFECFEKEGFAKKFWSPFGDDKERIGQSFKVVGRCSTKDSDLSSLPMWNIKFSDGTVIGAYPEEIIPREMKENGCPLEGIE